MKRLLPLFFVFLIFPVVLLAQERTIKGTVTDDEGVSLPGVTVLVKGTTQGTSTDLDGNYSLSGVTPETILVFSYVGFEAQEILVGNQNTIDVKLKASSQSLDEVVVTALGVKRQKREIGYSTEKVDKEVIVQSNAPNVINAIAGRSAGVQISQGDGLEGGSTRITIRGNNNFTGNNQPLIVVDNVPLTNTPGLEDIGRGIDWGNGISDINPQDIESFNVLKGGAASALYGAKGANGVILITTKRGKKQPGIGVTYNYSFKSIRPYRFRDMQNKYGAGGPISFTPPTFPMDNDTMLYPGIYGTDNLILNEEGDVSDSQTEFGYYGSAVSWGPEMKGQMVKWWDGKMRPYSPQPENYESVFRNGYTQTHNIAASGGSDKGTIRVSITRQDHKAIVENSDFDRTTINLGANLKVSDRVTADVSVSYVKFNRLNSPLLGEDWDSFSKGFLYSWPRSYKLLDRENYMNSNGTRRDQEGFPFYYISPHLWWNYFENNTNLSRDKYFGSITLSYDVTDWLSLMGRVGRDFALDEFTRREKPTDFVGIQNGKYANSLQRNYVDNYEAILTADKNISKKLNAKLTLGTSRYDRYDYRIGGASGNYWYYPNMYTFFNLTDPNNDGDGWEIYDLPSEVAASEFLERERINSVFSFLNFSYDDYLFLELTARNDWSSTLPPESNSYFYPSASISFVATEAFSIQNKIYWLNFLKLRGGIAQAATDADPYKRHFYYTTGFYGGEQTSGLPGTIPPFALKPQRTNAYEAGVNIGIFENVVDFDFTYYYMYSFDQYMPGLPVPSSSGASFLTTNEGIVTNEGIELIINAVPVKTNNILLKTGLNFARNRNYIVDLGGYAEQFPLADIWGLNGPAMALREGDEYGTIYGYDYVYHENGQPIVSDDGTNYLISDVRKPIGNASPDFIAGWSTQFSFKGFTISTLVDTKWGGDIYCGSYVINLQTGQSPETLIERDGGGLPYTDPAGNTSNIGVVLDGVYEDGTPNDKVVHYYYKYLPNAGGWGKFLSTPGVIENSWVKMREIAISYQVPTKVTSWTKVFQKATISLVGRDLFYIYSSLPDNINPEGIMGSGNAQGFEWASLPASRSFTIGISASF